MRDSESSAGAPPAVEHRLNPANRPRLVGVPVREDDIEPAEGIRAIALLFRGMAILLVLLMIVQVALGLSDTMPISIGVLLAEAVRLVIFAGLLWGVGDLAVLWIKSHHDLRATRILVARINAALHDRGTDGQAPEHSRRVGGA
jgi:hypothetical protein